jgi:hypothetical protein
MTLVVIVMCPNCNAAFPIDGHRTDANLAILYGQGGTIEITQDRRAVHNCEREDQVKSHTTTLRSP